MLFSIQSLPPPPLRPPAWFLSCGGKGHLKEAVCAIDCHRKREAAWPQSWDRTPSVDGTLTPVHIATCWVLRTGLTGRPMSAHQKLPGMDCTASHPILNPPLGSCLKFLLNEVCESEISDSSAKEAPRLLSAETLQGLGRLTHSHLSVNRLERLRMC